MELRVIIEILKRNIKLISLYTLIGVVIGIASFFIIPQKYVSSGSLFVTRQIEKNTNEYFSYEGYYAQQTAQFYTNSLTGLVESIDVKSSTLDKMNVPVTEYTLRELSRNLKVKKTGPQLINISIKGYTFENAAERWKSLVDSTLESIQKINEKSDPMINVSKVAETPITKEEYRNVFLNTILGASVGFFFSLFTYLFKNYYYEQRN
ncbi:hypothetical protein A2W32_05520 [candidate division WWE3 bacterium RBG_16_37_10]|uniref:Polysaccharide chain length determinant N-terminal domain-containing protein n=1 Tax=candidate division WWE3 bacterium RBG_16_37_10 TaxID=1802610 RepID=A0A1F4UXC7_UNCKA|nr:MAG: hypothetical protein A2W32_05520 [candidate division WWE3 bacterium RBG_16_37_10]